MRKVTYIDLSKVNSIQYNKFIYLLFDYLTRNINKIIIMY